MEKFFQNTKYFILNTILVLFLLFFLPFTQEFFVTNKFYLLVFFVLLLLLSSIFCLLSSKKLSWLSRPLDLPVVLFITSIALSLIVSSPNKVQALLNPSFGLVMFLSLGILYFYLSRNNEAIKQFNNIAIFSSLFLSIITIAFFFQPFKNVSLPIFLQFLKNPSFTPLGNQLDLAVFLGFFLIYNIVVILVRPKAASRIVVNNDSGQAGMTKSIINYSFLTFNLLALFLTLYSLLKPSTGLINQAPTLILPPFRLSWYATVETLKRPLTALFGIGIDNFSSIFTRVKDLAYNQSSLWQINAFNVSRSAILHIFTETGILGIAAFGLLIFIALKSAIKQRPFIFLFFYLFICLLIFPTSLIVWFLFFVLLAQISQQYNNMTIKQSFDLSDLPPLYLGIVVIIFGVIGISSYFLARSYASEYYFKKSLDGIVKNNLKEVYDNQRQAVVLNPYIERFRLNFSQTNLLIANNLAAKKPETITDQDRQTIAQAIQAGIAEAKAAVSLNPQKADNWENLAVIYRNIINFAQGSDVWTISAYQRAIIMDPQNPLYRVNLGGVYYSLGKYDEAVKFFEQAIGLKSDWSNAYYNLAWAYFQNKEYDKAATAMQNVVNLVDKKITPKDWEKVNKELEDFKNKQAETK